MSKRTTKYNPFPESQRARMAARKISYAFPKSPTGRLMFAIISKAIVDAYDHPVPKQDVRTAHRYLSGEMPHASLCNIDSDWIRLVIRKAGLTINHGPATA